MSISKDELVKRKEQIKKDFDSLVEQIKTEEDKIKSMQDAGITIAKSPAEIGKTLYNKLSL